jgi:hypothetical protein
MMNEEIFSRKVDKSGDLHMAEHQNSRETE